MKRLRLRLLGLSAWIYFPSVFASDGSEITSILTKFVELMQSNIARILAVIAIIGVGYGTVFLGKIPKERAISIIAGICIIFGAKFILQQLGYSVE